MGVGARVAVGTGVAVGAGVAVGTGVAVGAGVAVGIGVGVGVGVGVLGLGGEGGLPTLILVAPPTVWSDLSRSVRTPEKVYTRLPWGAVTV